MPRRQYVTDLQSAVAGASIAGISNVRPGGDDGEFTFHCVTNGAHLEISALVTDVSEYPSSHNYMIFCPDGTPAIVANTLSDISDSTTGKSIIQLLELVSRKLEMIDEDGDRHMLDSQMLSEDDFEGYDDEEDSDDCGYFGDDFKPELALATRSAGDFTNSTKSTPTFRQRIRSDLRKAKKNGFKVGCLGGLLDGHGCYVSLSCRISKLGISEEAMKAWQVEPSEYLVVLFHYPAGYKTMETLISYDNATADRYFGVRIGISSTYKPTMQEAVRAFAILNKEDEKRLDEASQMSSQSQGESPKGFRNSFISRPLNGLLKERFPSLLRYRDTGMPWSGAEDFYNDHIGANIARLDGFQDKYHKPEQINAVYPRIVTADHIQDCPPGEHSLPLVGMQFVLRHFVRCTEFCLICFSKLSEELEAIKPYVCEKPLCLYQYMSLGFGPSIEHEILSQPKVVDLLISFCYASARMGHLKDFPTGLGLMVPRKDASSAEYIKAPQPAYHYHDPAPPPMQATASTFVKPLEMRFNEAAREMIFPDRSEKCPVQKGNWVVIRIATGNAKGEDRVIHCRVAENFYWPTVEVGEPVFPAITWGEHYAPQRHSSTKPASARTSGAQTPLDNTTQVAAVNEFRPATFYIYDQNFDQLPDQDKMAAVYALLDVLPSVAEMGRYLKRRIQSPLSSWVDRLSPAVLGILRWIIASNRACIMQIEDDDSEERVHGMHGWSQFRFAMGAPDKERRFVKAVRETSARLGLKYPTIFAFHGSPLRNWHSIIREGLHFREISHGRAYGNGVYHSQDLFTSMGYSNGFNAYWQGSELKISQAMALNEIVNAPKEYVSSSPHLVVAQLDWIQTRYLFVKSADATAPATASGSSFTGKKPTKVFEQDPSMTPRGIDVQLIIPANALPGSRRNMQSTLVARIGHKRLKTGDTIFQPIEIDDDDNSSVATLDEDRTILEDSDDELIILDPNTIPHAKFDKGKSKIGSLLSKFGASKTPSKPLTDFVPGTLDFSKLPMLQQPTWATPGATKRLMRDFQELVKVQQKEPLHELGWYIDPEHAENMYQWIVELHSFDPQLPLAKDMKAKKITSIVLELRFGNQYPMTPPFVRVIRPRFLGFQQGGGGHVTAGGAMCMELLTNDGWSAVSSIESVLLQVRIAISSTEPRPARLENSSRIDYGVGEAIDAYIRACQVHGWTVPAGFREMALGGAPTSSVPGYYAN